MIRSKPQSESAQNDNVDYNNDDIYTIHYNDNDFDKIYNSDEHETCIIAVRKDCGLKNPGSQTDIGRLKSAVQPFHDPLK